MFYLQRCIHIVANLLFGIDFRGCRFFVEVDRLHQLLRSGSGRCIHKAGRGLSSSLFLFSSEIILCVQVRCSYL